MSPAALAIRRSSCCASATRSTARPCIVLQARSRGAGPMQHLGGPVGAQTSGSARRDQVCAYDMESVDRLGEGLDQALAMFDDCSQPVTAVSTRAVLSPARSVRPPQPRPRWRRRSCGRAQSRAVVPAQPASREHRPHPLRHRPSGASMALPNRWHLRSPIGCWPFSGESAQLSVAVVADRRPYRGQRLQRRVDCCCGLRRLVWISDDRHLTFGMFEHLRHHSLLDSTSFRSVSTHPRPQGGLAHILG